MVENKQNKLELRDKIIAFAMPEFYKRGVKAVKMDEISVELHVSKRTVYEIFGDKEEMLIAGIKAKHEEMKRNVEAYASAKAKNVIDVISYVYRQQMKVNKMVGVVFYEEIHRMPRVVTFLQELRAQERDDSLRFFEAGVREGLFRADVNYEILIDTANVSMEEIMHRQLYRKYSMKDLFAHHFLIVIRGLCTEKGVRLLEKAMESSEHAQSL